MCEEILFRRGSPLACGVMGFAALVLKVTLLIKLSHTIASCSMACAAKTTIIYHNFAPDEHSNTFATSDP